MQTPLKQQLCVGDSEKPCNGGLIFKDQSLRDSPAHQCICRAKPEDPSSIPRTHCREIPQSCPDSRRHTSCAQTHTLIINQPLYPVTNRNSKYSLH